MLFFIVLGVVKRERKIGGWQSFPPKSIIYFSFLFSEKRRRKKMTLKRIQNYPYPFLSSQKKKKKILCFFAFIDCDCCVLNYYYYYLLRLLVNAGIKFVLKFCVLCLLLLFGSPGSLKREMASSLKLAFSFKI